MLPRIVRSPVEICFGTSPSHGSLRTNLAHFSRYLLRFVSLPRDGAPSSSLRLPSCWAEGVATPFFLLFRAQSLGHPSRHRIVISLGSKNLEHFDGPFAIACDQPKRLQIVFAPRRRRVFRPWLVHCK